MYNTKPTSRFASRYYYCLISIRRSSNNQCDADKVPSDFGWWPRSALGRERGYTQSDHSDGHRSTKIFCWSWPFARQSIHLNIVTPHQLASATRSQFGSGALWQTIPKESSYFVMPLKLQNVIKSCMKITFADLITKRVEGLNRRDTRFIYQMTCYRMSLRNFVQVRLFWPTTVLCNGAAICKTASFWQIQWIGRIAWN